MYFLPLLVSALFVVLLFSLEVESRSDLPGRCQLPKRIGKCRGYNSRWFFNTKSQRCEMFHWGGCDGNDNRFMTKRECKTTCRYLQRSAVPGICSLPMKRGPCRMMNIKYYFDSSVQECKQFTYGGCSGNENNFKTMRLCEERCKSQCSLPKKRGPCYSNILRFFYNGQTGKCESFWWGGCYPNENNFDGLHECQEMCVKDPSKRFHVWNPFLNLEEYLEGDFNAAFRRSDD